MLITRLEAVISATMEAIIRTALTRMDIKNLSSRLVTGYSGLFVLSCPVTALYYIERQGEVQNTEYAAELRGGLCGKKHAAEPRGGPRGEGLVIVFTSFS
jgi:hypothetical protein